MYLVMRLKDRSF